MDIWGKDNIIHIDLYKQLNITAEKIQGSSISKKKYGMTDFKYNVLIRPKTESDLYLNDTNSDILYNVLGEIFKLVQSCYNRKTDKDSVISLDLGFEGLKMKYIKSGPMLLFDPHANNIVDWVAAQLDR